ncbi:hypothetical protein SAY87_003347 [Trapa incisa]|uniref:Uncharacterized protein n=1 Tax=Trapa incisa TaxID=236973 RepID=A0AAN7KJ60_9MYRT|nr:hypothetical protein SAY87_003347 [Trapa incisa]
MIKTHQNSIMFVVELYILALASALNSAYKKIELFCAHQFLSDTKIQSFSAIPSQSSASSYLFSNNVLGALIGVYPQAMAGTTPPYPYPINKICFSFPNVQNLAYICLC